MIRRIEINIAPEKAFDEESLKKAAADELETSVSDITAVRPLRRSLDARKARPVYNLRLDVYLDEKPVDEEYELPLKDLIPGKKVIIVGAGPAGYFASLKFLEFGVKPVIYERGNDVSARKRDIRALVREGKLNPQSNFCFGEGGAGTFSDGKLYTRSTKKGDVKGFLRKLIYFGAKEDIAVDAHPHLGSDKLSGIVTNIRNAVLGAGGEIFFGAEVTGLIIERDKVAGVVVNGTENEYADAVMLAAGGSARELFDILIKEGVKIEAKPYAAGVRVEHLQSRINSIRYGKAGINKFLPTASYTVKTRVDDRGVFSFCMCPGGVIVPSSTETDGLVINGMSGSKRNSPFANSGIVTEVGPAEFSGFSSRGELAGMQFQRSLEVRAAEAGGGGFKAPAQNMMDFIDGKLTRELPKSSYIPGLTAYPVHTLFSEEMYKRLRDGLLAFNRKLRGYVTREAVVLGVESRTSSPVRIPRDRETFMHVQIDGLFPAGEGAGYAGGIASSALDGELSAEAVCSYLGVK